jgi:ribonuclease P protein component
MRRFASLRRSGDFARLRARGRRTATANLTMFRGEPAPADTHPLVGISVSKSVGTAVVRNRIRRRLAACIHELIPEGARMRFLVLVRPSAAQATYRTLCAEIGKAIG